MPGYRGSVFGTKQPDPLNRRLSNPRQWVILRALVSRSSDPAWHLTVTLNATLEWPRSCVTPSQRYRERNNSADIYDRSSFPWRRELRVAILNGVSWTSMSDASSEFRLPPCVLSRVASCKGRNGLSHDIDTAEYDTSTCVMCTDRRMCPHDFPSSASRLDVTCVRMKIVVTFCP